MLAGRAARRRSASAPTRWWPSSTASGGTSWCRCSRAHGRRGPRPATRSTARAAGGGAGALHAPSVFPALTPLAVDPGHPFPHLRNKSLNLAVLLRREGRKRRRRRAAGASLAVVQVPERAEPAGPAARRRRAGARSCCSRSSSRCTSASCSPASPWSRPRAFRVTRNWDLNVDEEESEDLLSTIQEELRRRDRGAAVRLELDAGATPELERVARGGAEAGPDGRLPRPRARCSSPT